MVGCRGRRRERSLLCGHFPLSLWAPGTVCLKSQLGCWSSTERCPEQTAGLSSHSLKATFIMIGLHKRLVSAMRQGALCVWTAGSKAVRHTTTDRAFRRCFRGSNGMGDLSHSPPPMGRAGWGYLTSDGPCIGQCRAVNTFAGYQGKGLCCELRSFAL